MDRALDDQTWERARSRCEYCLLPARYTEAPFQIDHLIAKKHGGETIAAKRVHLFGYRTIKFH